MPKSILAAAAAFLAVAPLRAQMPTPMGEVVPSISGSATSDMKVMPDRATIRIAVETHAATATLAASQNATLQNRVLTALRALGLSNDWLGTVGYNVNPEYKYQENHAPVVTGYAVTNTVVADVRDLTLVGKVLDAAIAAGANSISSLEFYASNTDSARQKVIAMAIAKTHAEAVAAAQAAGGTLGSLLTLSIGEAPPPPQPIMRPMMAMAKSSVDQSTSINPSEQTVMVTVSASWRFVAAK